MSPKVKRRNTFKLVNLERDDKEFIRKPETQKFEASFFSKRKSMTYDYKSDEEMKKSKHISLYDEINKADPFKMH